MSQRYRSQRREDELNEDLSAKPDNNANPEGGDPNLDPSPDNDGEGGNWKKRHGDLRRHAAKKEEELSNRIKELEKAVSEASKANIKYPVTEDEFAEWATKYPVIHKMMRTAVLKEMNAGDGASIDRVAALEEQIARDKLDRQKEIALAQIIKAHPDFLKLVEEDKFQDWIGEQSQWVQDALWDNETDSRSAIDAVDLYKTRNKVPNPKSKEQEVQNASIGSRSGGGAPSGEADVLYLESAVARMTDAEYERHEPKIKEAIRDGKFKYDLSQAS